MRSFDFVIVGAGAAGCVLANRLSADPAINVLLLEAGPPDTSPLIHMPAGVGQMMKSGAFDWGYHTTPQTHLNGRQLHCPRGRVLGGSTSTNGLVAVRGSARDYDAWREAGAAGWSYDDVLPFFRRLENHPNGDTAFHGNHGPIRISRYQPRGPMERAWIQAVQEAGHPANDDFAGASLEGVGVYDRNVFRGQRQSASFGYLTPALSRPNLTVITQAMVARINLSGKRAIGVGYTHDGSEHNVSCGEVLLCGGAVNSPQTLMLSGIGNPEHLSAHNIDVRTHLPGVGQNLHDHLVAAVSYLSPLPVSYLRYRTPLRMIAAGLQYALFRSGLAAEPGPSMAAFLKTNPTLSEPDVQYHFVPLIYRDSGREIINAHGSLAMCNVCRPKSRGSISLRSNDYREGPVVDPNYFADADDRATLVAGLRLAREIAQQPAFTPYRGNEFLPGIEHTRDAALEEHIRATAESIYHPVGSCKMGNDDAAVVDPDLRVHGVDRLRVIDASIMPTIISGNTNLATMMIAEKAADLILANRRNAANA